MRMAIWPCGKTYSSRQIRASAERRAMRLAVMQITWCGRYQAVTLETGLDCAESVTVTSGVVADRFSSPLWSNW